MVSFRKKTLYILIIVFLVGLVIGIIKRSKILILLFTILSGISIFLFTSVKIRERYLHPELSDILRKVVEKLNQHDIKYWVDYGSLLGIIREGDVIKHDTDTDVCVHPDNKNIEKKLHEIVNELGHPYYLEYHPYDIFLYRIKKELPKPLGLFLNPCMDIYGIKVTKDNMYEDCTGKIPVELVGNLQKIPWKGLQISVPEKIHESLVWRYGENYGTSIISKDAVSNNK